MDPSGGVDAGTISSLDKLSFQPTTSFLDHSNPLYSWDSPNSAVNRETHPDFGRFITSAREIRSGEVVLEGQPYAVIVYPKFKQTCCNTCLKLFNQNNNSKHQQQTLIDGRTEASVIVDAPSVCTGCREIWYCSSHCRENPTPHTLHRPAECRSYKRLYSNPTFTLDEVGEAKLLIRIVCRRADELNSTYNLQNVSTNNKDVTFDHVLDLVSNKERIGQVDPKSYKHFHLVAEFVLKLLPPSIILGLTHDKLMDLSCIIGCNSFGIWTKKLELAKGLGLYPNCSFFNHSCAPNCARYQDGTSLKIRALYDIPPNTELCISYIELEEGTESRQRILNGFYYFKCLCHRCQTNDSDESNQKILPYLCSVKGCAGLLILDSGSDNTNKRVCSGCGHVQILHQ